MDRKQALRSIVKLLLLMGLAFGYTFFTAGPRTLTGDVRQDGVIGVVLGLFVCSQPAAYVVDLFYRSRRRPAGEPRWVWPLLNLLTFFAGVTVVVLGTIQLAQATPFH